MNKRFLTVTEAAEYLDRSVGTLRYWRHLNKGPRSGCIGGRVLYRLEDLDAWVDEQFESDIRGGVQSFEKED